MSGNNQQVNGSDIVNFPVPRKYLPAVIQALARIIEDDQQVPSLPAESSNASVVLWPTPETEGQKVSIVWDEATLRNLRGRLNNTAVLTLLDMAADRPGERVYVEDVKQELGCTHGQVGAGLGVLTKCISKMLPQVKGKRFNWPAAFNWDAEEQLAFYVMDTDVANGWKAATKGDKKMPTQREMMRRLVSRFGRDEDKVVEEYAAAEQRGEVERKRNDYAIPPESYARALWNDGVRKGWL